MSRVYDSNSSQNPTASDRRGSQEPGEGILRHTQGQDKTSCRTCSTEVSGLTAHLRTCPDTHADTRTGASKNSLRLAQPPTTVCYFPSLQASWDIPTSHSTLPPTCAHDLTNQCKQSQQDQQQVPIDKYRACMTRTPPKIRRRLTGGVLRTW